MAYLLILFPLADGGAGVRRLRPTAGGPGCSRPRPAGISRWSVWAPWRCQPADVAPGRLARPRPTRQGLSSASERLVLPLLALRARLPRATAPSAPTACFCANLLVSLGA